MRSMNTFSGQRREATSGSTLTLLAVKEPKMVETDTSIGRITFSSSDPDSTIEPRSSTPLCGSATGGTSVSRPTLDGAGYSINTRTIVAVKSRTLPSTTMQKLFLITEILTSKSLLPVTVIAYRFDGYSYVVSRSSRRRRRLLPRARVILRAGRC